MKTSKYTNLSASAQIQAGSGTLYGIIVNSHTSGTIKLWDSLTAANSIVMNTFTFATGSQVYMFPMGISYYTGLYATLGGTADVTLLTAPN
jgi:hypothetical protein